MKIDSALNSLVSGKNSQEEEEISNANRQSVSFLGRKVVIQNGKSFPHPSHLYLIKPKGEKLLDLIGISVGIEEDGKHRQSWEHRQSEHRQSTEHRQSSYDKNGGGSFI